MKFFLKNLPGPCNTNFEAVAMNKVDMELSIKNGAPYCISVGLGPHF